MNMVNICLKPVDICLSMYYKGNLEFRLSISLRTGEKIVLNYDEKYRTHHCFALCLRANI